MEVEMAAEIPGGGTGGRQQETIGRLKVEEDDKRVKESMETQGERLIRRDILFCWKFFQHLNYIELHLN